MKTESEGTGRCGRRQSWRTLAACAIWLVLVRVPAVGAEADPFAKWEKEISAFERSDATNPPPKGAIVFVGSSSIRLWKTLAEDFPALRVINRGFGGSEVVDSTHFADRIVVPYAPRQVVVYAGANDINNGKTAEQVAADFRSLVEKLRSRLPHLPVAFIAIAGNPARWAQIEKVRRANTLIADYCKATPGLAFIDTHREMLGADGLPRPELFVEDRLHMNAEGYRLWKRVVGPFLVPEKT